MRNRFYLFIMRKLLVENSFLIWLTNNADYDLALQALENNYRLFMVYTDEEKRNVFDLKIAELLK